jgi:hypothetical protein
MTTLYYNGFQATEGTTTVNQFWGDIHVLTFRADAVITDQMTMKDVCIRFVEDREAFDRTLYNTHAENVKANRVYESLLQVEKSLEKLVFEFKGKTYCTMTTKWSKVREIQKNADKIIEHKQVWVDAVVNDRTNEIVAKGEIKRELDKLLFEDCI